MAALPVPSVLLCPYRLPMVGYWQLSGVSVCPSLIGSSRDLPPKVSSALFLDHFSSHSDSFLVFTDGSKSGAGVGFSVVFPFFCRECSLLKIAAVFTAELSPIRPIH